MMMSALRSWQPASGVGHGEKGGRRGKKELLFCLEVLNVTHTPSPFCLFLISISRSPISMPVGKERLAVHDLLIALRESHLPFLVSNTQEGYLYHRSFESIKKASRWLRDSVFYLLCE